MAFLLHMQRHILIFYFLLNPLWTHYCFKQSKASLFCQICTFFGAYIVKLTTFASISYDSSSRIGVTWIMSYKIAQSWNHEPCIPYGVTMFPVGHKVVLIFPLAAMLRFCQIIRKLNFLHSHCSHITDMLIKFRQKSISQPLLKCIHVYCPSIFTKLSTRFCIRCKIKWLKITTPI